MCPAMKPLCIVHIITSQILFFSLRNYNSKSEEHLYTYLLSFSRMVHNCDLVNMQCKYDCNRVAFSDGILFVLWGHYTSSTFDGTFVHVYFLSKINLDTLRCYLISIFSEARARVPSLAWSRLQNWCISLQYMCVQLFMHRHELFQHALRRWMLLLLQIPPFPYIRPSQ